MPVCSIQLARSPRCYEPARVVHGFAILQEGNPQIFVIRLGNLRPPSYTSVCLDFFLVLVIDNLLDISSLPMASRQYAAVSTIAVSSTP